MLLWRRLGRKGLLSDNKFENILLSIVNNILATPENLDGVVELKKLKSYLAWFIYSGHCVEYRLYVHVRKGLHDLEHPSLDVDAKSRPFLYVYDSKYGIVPVARRASELPSTNHQLPRYNRMVNT